MSFIFPIINISCWDKSLQVSVNRLMVWSRFFALQGRLATVFRLFYRRFKQFSLRRIILPASLISSLSLLSSLLFLSVALCLWLVASTSRWLVVRWQADQPLTTSRMFSYKAQLHRIVILSFCHQVALCCPSAKTTLPQNVLVVSTPPA